MIITLCASTKFYDHVNKLVPKLKALGHEVFQPKTSLPNVKLLKDDASEKYREWRKSLIDVHLGKIEKSDAILVVNDSKNGVSGYIGTNTLMEITIAYYLKKKVFILNAVDSENPVYDEVFAINATILDGDLSKIS